MPDSLHPYVPARNQRLAAGLYETAGHVCFVTIRAYRHQSPFTSPPRCQAMINTLRDQRILSRCLIHAFCLMPDHLQMLTSPREDGCSVLTFVDRFKGKSTNESWRFGWQGKLWQPRNYDHVVRTEESLEAIAEYILSDPVRSGLVAEADEYPWRGMWDPFPL